MMFESRRRGESRRVSDRDDSSDWSVRSLIFNRRISSRAESNGGWDGVASEIG